MVKDGEGEHGIQLQTTNLKNIREIFQDAQNCDIVPTRESCFSW